MISVLDHGAVGDGTTDDTAAIDAALYAATAGEAVLIPGGHTYRTRGGFRSIQNALVAFALAGAGTA